MKNFISLAIAVSAMSVPLTMSASAHAAYYHWVSDGHKVNQVSYGPYVIGRQSAGSGNYYVETQQAWNTWVHVAEGAGISIASGASGTWVVTNQNTIWKLIGNGWYTVPNGNCEGGTVSVSKTLENSNIAVGQNDHAYVVATDGAAAGGTNIRRFTGSCWEIMPGQGKGVEVAMTDSGSDTPWVRTAVNGLWAFNGTGWTQQQGAVVTSVGTGLVAGADTTLLFTCSLSPQSCTQDTTWNLGSVHAVGGRGVVIGPDDQIIVYTFAP